MNHFPPSVQPVEIFWTLFGLLPLVLLDARRLLRLRRASVKLRDDGLNGRDRVAINWHITITLLAAGGHAIITLIGCAAMLATPVSRTAPSTTPTLLVVSAGLFLLSALFTGLSIADEVFWRISANAAAKYAHLGNLPEGGACPAPQSEIPD